MRYLTRSIAGQLIVLIVGAILLSQLLVMVIFFVKAEDRIDEYEDHFVIKHIASVYNKAQNTSKDRRELLLEFSSTPDIAFSITPNSLGTSRFESSAEADWFSSQLGSEDVRVLEVSPPLQSIWSFWFTDEMDNCFSVESDAELPDQCSHRTYSLPLENGKWLNAKMALGPDEVVLLLPVIFAAFFTLLSITVVVVLCVRRITAPLRHLSNAADKLGRGERMQLLNIAGPQELSSTTRAFNLMQKRLTRFIQDRTKMLAAISHDLRTPITSLRLNTEFVEDEELREKMISILGDMQVMVEACLSFSQQEVTEEDTRVIDLVQTLEDLTDDFAGIGFSSDTPSYDYSCRSVSIKRAIRNLLENAVKYGGEAQMRFEKANEQIIITIQDQGQGIPEEKLQEVFEPFVRLEEARNTQSGSVGLGLAIARTIIHKHGGSIEAVNTYPGLRMMVQLPVLKSISPDG